MKIAEKTKLEEEIGEKVIDSPLRRAREYACSLAGSPSPLRKVVKKGSYEFHISPEKSTEELRMTRNASPCKAQEQKVMAFAIEPKVTDQANTAKPETQIKSTKKSPFTAKNANKNDMVTPEKRAGSLPMPMHQRSMSSKHQPSFANGQKIGLTSNKKTQAKHVKNLV